MLWGLDDPSASLAPVTLTLTSCDLSWPSYPSFLSLQARLEEEKRVQEELRLAAEEARRQEEAASKAQEEARLAQEEDARLAAAAAEEARKVEAAKEQWRVEKEKVMELVMVMETLVTMMMVMVSRYP